MFGLLDDGELVVGLSLLDSRRWKRVDVVLGELRHGGSLKGREAKDGTVE